MNFHPIENNDEKPLSLPHMNSTLSTSKSSKMSHLHIILVLLNFMNCIFILGLELIYRMFKEDVILH